MSSLRDFSLRQGLMIIGTLSAAVGLYLPWVKPRNPENPVISILIAGMETGYTLVDGVLRTCHRRGPRANRRCARHLVDDDTLETVEHNGTTYYRLAE